MNKAFRLGIYICILLAMGMFVACSDDEPAPAEPGPEPEPDPVAGSIGVYMDVAGEYPDIVNTGGLVTLYVVQKGTNGCVATAFRIEAPAGWTKIGEISQFPVSIGNIEGGVSIAYGECLTGTIHLMTLTFQSPGGSGTGNFTVLPHQAYPNGIQAVDCHETMLDDGVGLITPVVLP